MRVQRRTLLPAALCVLVPYGAFALGKLRDVETAGGSGSFPIVQRKKAAAICVDANDYAVVARRFLLAPRPGRYQ